MNNARVIDGYLVKHIQGMPITEIENNLQSDDILKKGLLFVGGARQGKTNVMMKLTSDIISSLNSHDVLVILDVKGDYKEAFFQEGDVILSPTDDSCLWNIFEELKIIPFGDELDARVQEIVEYLYYGFNSQKDPFWTNAAKIITYCLIMYLLYEADSSDDDTNLNHFELCNLIDGVVNDDSDEDSVIDAYENYRRIMNSYSRFQTAQLFLPPIESGMMGPGVITEIIVMRQRLFRAAFGKKKVRSDQLYISPGIISRFNAPLIVFLEFDQRARATCTPVFRYFIDMLISEYTGKSNIKGYLYLMLDELAVLPELENLSRALSLGAGRGIRVVAALQEIEQIRNNYQEHPHDAEVLIGSFQNQVIFNSDVKTAKYFQEIFDKAIIQRIFTKPGGGIGYTEPVEVNSIDVRDFQNLEVGQAVVHFSGKKAFIKKFPIYE